MTSSTKSNEALFQYFESLTGHLRKTEVSARSGEAISVGEGVRRMMRNAQSTHDSGKKIIFVGNGGSAAICSHMATDYSKNGGLRSIALNDGAMLTCLGNDLGFENVFATQLKMHAQKDDMAVIISSSGRSQNILRAAEQALKSSCFLVTLSGFTPDNPLRKLGHLNFYLDSNSYGFVEIGHLTLCHAVLDFICASRPPAPVQ